MTQAELDFYTQVPRLLRNLVASIESQNKAIEKLTEAVEELELNNK